MERRIHRSVDADPDILCVLGQDSRMTVASPPLRSLAVDPRARLVLFDIADDPDVVAMEVQVFDDPVQGRGLLVLLARRDGMVEIYRQPQLRLGQRPFSVGRGIASWAEAEIDPARVDIAPDGIDVHVGFEDARGRRIEVRIDDRDGTPRRRSTLLAPVSSGVERPEQLLVVLLREFDLVRASGTEPRLTIGGATRRFAAFPGPEGLHRRRFMRYSAAPVIVTALPTVEGPVDPASLGPLAELRAGEDPVSARLRFDPPTPDLVRLAEGAQAGGAWALDVADERDLIAGTWTVVRSGHSVDLTMTVTHGWRPRGLPLSLRLVTTVARVFRDWPLSYRWDAHVDLAPTPPVARARWTRVTGPDRADPYAVRMRPGRWLAALAALAAVAVLGRFAWRRARRSPGDP